MELKHYVRMLQKGWWIIALATLLAINIVLIASYVTPPTYRSSTKLIISPSPEIVNERDMVTSLEALEKRSIISTYREFLESRKVYLEATGTLGINPNDLRDYQISTAVLADSNILELSVVGPNPDLAALLANTIGEHAIENLSRLYRAYNIAVVDPAIPANTPIRPRPVRDVSLAVLIGLVGGGILAILGEELRTPLETYRLRRRLDTVTHVYNARYFRKLLDDELIQNPEEVLSIGIVELTGLQDYVDTLPSMALQRVLLKVTDILRKELRGNDVVARWTGTSFIVMLPATTGIAASRTFDRIYQSLSQPIELEQYSVVLNLDPHIGGAVYSDEISAQELILQAENSVEQARRGNGNTEQIYVWEIKKPFWSPQEPEASEA